jgi:hypothetical protein
MLSMNRLDYNRVALSLSDFLKNSALSSASPRLRVESQRLDLPLTHPPAQPSPNFPHSMTDDADLAQALRMEKPLRTDCDSSS